jgi:hypothetical protein
MEKGRAQRQFMELIERAIEMGFTINIISAEGQLLGALQASGESSDPNRAAGSGGRVTSGPMQFYDTDSGTWKEMSQGNWAGSNNGIATINWGTAFDSSIGGSSALDRLTANDYQQGRINSSYRALRPFEAIMAAGRETFGNAVFQQPLTTLATTGVHATALVGTAYAGVAAAPNVIAGATAAARPIWVATQVAVIAHGPGVTNTATSALRFVQYNWYRAQAAITQAINGPRPPPPSSGPPIP